MPFEFKEITKYKELARIFPKGRYRRRRGTHAIVCSIILLAHHVADVAPCGACRPWIFFINGVLCFLKIMAAEWRRRKMIVDATSRRR